jgi:hypothetical protein
VWMRSSRVRMRSTGWVGWDLAECGWTLQTECGWDIAECGWGLQAECGWDLAECGWDLQAECGWDLAEWMRFSRVSMRFSRVWMRSSRMVSVSDSQCRSRNCPGFDPSILQHSGIWGAADVAVLIKYWKIKKSPLRKFKFPTPYCFMG